MKVFFMSQISKYSSQRNHNFFVTFPKNCLACKSKVDRQTDKQIAKFSGYIQDLMILQVLAPAFQIYRCAIGEQLNHIKTLLQKCCNEIIVSTLCRCTGIYAKLTSQMWTGGHHQNFCRYCQSVLQEIPYPNLHSLPTTPTVFGCAYLPIASQHWILTVFITLSMEDDIQMFSFAFSYSWIRLRTLDIGGSFKVMKF